MQIKNFLSRVLKGEGYYCSFALRKSDGRRVQKLYSDIEELVDASINLDKQGYDVYFGLSVFENDESRKATNSKYLSSFFLDIDCGVSKDYLTQAEGLTALKSFCGKLSLPKPTLINSGRGIHAYWILQEPVLKEEWLPVAQKLKQLCEVNNFRVDYAVPADVARVLRVPFTHNHKTDPPSEVTYITTGLTKEVGFDEFNRLLGGDTLPPPKLMEKKDFAYDHLESLFKTIYMKSRKGNGCEQIYRALNNQEEVPEPTWRGLLSVLKSCSDGSRERAHEVSQGHSEYNRYETDYKWDNIPASMPYTCNKFNEYAPDICTECPHWGKIGSPIVLGTRTKEAENNVVEAPAASFKDTPMVTYIIPPYPNPYFRGAKGGVYARTTNDDGDPSDKLIYHNDIYVVKRVSDAEIGECIVMRLHLPRDGVKEFTLPLTTVTSRDEFRKQMSAQGVAITRMDELMQYTTTWVNHLQDTETATMAHKQFGWVGEDFGSFVLGAKEVYADNIDFNPASNQTAGLIPSFEPKGSFEEWKDIINFYNREGFELHQYIIGIGFGSILMKFMPEIHCSTLHLYGKTGVGKTTAMMAAMSIWGDPDTLMMFERDTYNSRMNRGEVLHNLPLMMDELTNAPPKQLSDLIYQLTSGKQRMRMSGGSNLERFRGEPWNLLAVTTANASLIELINVYKAMPSAEAQRLLEIHVKPLLNTPASKEETDQLARRIKQNYGWAGVPYLQGIMRNRDKVESILFKTQKRVDEVGLLINENRFWSANAATALTGLMTSKKLGFHNFNVENVFKWITSELKTNKRRSDALGSNAEQLLNDYIHEHWGQVLWIKSTHDLRKKNTDMDEVLIPEAMPKGRLVARYETDIAKLYLVPKPLKEWCGRQQLTYSSFIEDLRVNMGARQDKFRLGKGTHIKLPPSNVIILNCKIDDTEAG